MTFCMICASSVVTPTELPQASQSHHHLDLTTREGRVSITRHRQPRAELWALQQGEKSTASSEALAQSIRAALRAGRMGPEHRAGTEGHPAAVSSPASPSSTNPKLILAELQRTHRPRTAAETSPGAGRAASAGPGGTSRLPAAQQQVVLTQTRPAGHFWLASHEMPKHWLHTSGLVLS